MEDILYNFKFDRKKLGEFDEFTSPFFLELCDVITNLCYVAGYSWFVFTLVISWPFSSKLPGQICSYITLYL